MDKILYYLQAIKFKLTALAGSSSLLLYVGLAFALVLIVLLLILRKVRGGHSHQEGDIEYLEVGPEPVIVYRKSSDPQQKKDPEPQAKPEPKQDQESVPETAQPAAAAEPETPEPASQPQEKVKTEAKLVSVPEPEPKFIPEPELEPEPLPDHTPAAPPQKRPDEPLPYLESELANTTLQFFASQGFRIETIVYQGTYGADYIVSRSGIRAYILVKDWKKKITDNTVQEAHSYANANECSQAIIITASGFSGAAVKAAGKIAVSLWNQKTLKKFSKKPFLLGGEEESAVTKH